MFGAKIVKKELAKEILRHHKVISMLKESDGYSVQRKMGDECGYFMMNYYKITGIDLHHEHTGQKFPFHQFCRPEDPDGIFHIKRGLFSLLWKRLKGLMKNNPTN